MTDPASRPEFWQAKFKANVARDEIVRTALLGDGWRVATVWECALRTKEQVEGRIWFACQFEGPRREASTRILSMWLQPDSLQVEIGNEDMLSR